MATVEIDNGRFAVGFEALDAAGKAAHFRSLYAKSGKPISVRELDPRSMVERFRQRRKKLPKSTIHQGIYQSHSLGSYLVFTDKLTSESQVFVNWRAASTSSYQRVALGRPAFHTYGRVPFPNTSELILCGGQFFIAWMTKDHPVGDLMLSSIDPKTAARTDLVIAARMPFVTMISLANIGSNGLIVCARAILNGKDAKIDVFPVRLRRRC